MTFLRLKNQSLHEMVHVHNLVGLLMYKLKPNLVKVDGSVMYDCKLAENLLTK